jgi:hypothetical protein
MTDEYEFYEPAEAYEKIIHLLRDLPEQLEKCNNYLQGEEEIEEDSEVDDYLVRVTEKMLCVIKALEEAEESDTWAHIRATDIGEDLVGEMDSVEKVILGYNIFGEGGHEVCTQAMVLADIVERLLGRRE